MRTPPEHERALLHADSAALRDCAARLDALTRAELPAQCGPDWKGVLTALARRCRVAADEIDGIRAAFFADPDPYGETVDGADGAEASARTRAQARAQAQAQVRALAHALALAGRVLSASRAVAEPLASLGPLPPIAPLIRRRPDTR
jgi:hypothetical protein